MGKIIIQGLKLFAFHGVNPEEQRDGQYFKLDITAEAENERAGESDDLQDTVSYAAMIKCARRVFTSQKDALIERAAYRVAQALLDEFSSISSVRVRCVKPDAPIKAEFDFVAVETELSR